MEKKKLTELFSLDGKVAIITGGAGTLGEMHAEIIADAGGIPILADLDGKTAQEKAQKISQQYHVNALGVKTDITNPDDVQKLLHFVLQKYKRVDILINNAANNPKVSAAQSETEWSRLEYFPLERWNKDIAVGLTGAFLCSQIIGTEMAKQGSGVILNISSDLGLIAPDQRLYQKPHLSEEKQPVKPVSYPVVKAALIGLTRYLATYWADKNIRVNSLSPGGVYENQSDEFLEKLHKLIPIGRMAKKDEYKGAILFLCSDASSYMTGSNLVVDGGRTCW
jgi:NAD(P)-dependent dehydrogenase (short-subunit alcohol dehydrogenase family)